MTEFWQFRSINFRNHLIRHRNFLGELTIEQGPRWDFAFEVVGEGWVRLKSRNFHTRYLRHRDFRLRLEGPSDPNPQLFRDDSLFWMRQPGLAGIGVSFESYNYRGRFIRHRNFHLYVEPRHSPNLVSDATFIKEKFGEGL
jgi:alpha-L-arabinofuranosidase B-like protein